LKELPMKAIPTTSLHEEINARAPRGIDWERDPVWAWQQVRRLAREKAARAFLTEISESLLLGVVAARARIVRLLRRNAPVPNVAHA
jgi:hypothetical protein